MTVKSQNIDLLEAYSKEFSEDCVLERATLDEKLLMIPGIKAKYVTRLYKHKKEKEELGKLYVVALDKAVEELTKTSQVKLSRPALEKAAHSHETVQKISERIQDLSLLVDYLEKVVATISGIGYDIKNIVEWTKMELT